MVIEPGGVGEHKGPKLGVIFVRPMDLEMKEHSTGAGGNGTNGTLGMGILMMSSNARKGLSLFITMKGASPGLAGNNIRYRSAGFFTGRPRSKLPFI